MANADISLLFGVLGEGSLSGESGALIQSQLNQIMASLNKNPLKVKVALDTETGGQKSWSSQLQSKLNTISTSGKFSVKVSKIELGAGAITDFKKQLNAVINTLNLDKGTSITLTAEGIGEIKSQMREAGNAADEAARKVAEFKVQMEALGNLKTSVQKSLSSLTNGNETEEEKARIAGLTTQYEQWAIKIEEVRASKTAASGTYRAELEAEGAAIQDNINKLHQERQAAADAAAAQQAETKSRQAAEDAAKRAAEEARAAEEKARVAAAERNTLYKQISDAIVRIRKAQQDWNAAENGKSSSAYADLEGYIKRLQDLQGQFGNLSKTQIREQLTSINKEFAESSNVIKAAGENTKTLTGRIGNLAGKFTSWLTVSQVIMQVYRALKQMVTAVIEVDTAMTELRKVTDETEATYSKFLDTAISRSKQLGATVADTVTASADFARLGYSLSEAAQLADSAIIYKNVGDGIEDITAASESIISTMKAFGIEAENSMFIVDKFNEVGNNFAISSKGVGDALIRSASALASGNNTLDESIALITAANSVVQDADKVGTTLKTVSMFLRAAKTEAEAAGESTDGMANSVSELRAELLALTGGKVDIQIDESTFKSTYQIIKELSQVWGELTDITQANILEMVGGKRNSNVVASLLTNFETAEQVIESAANAAGSALAENEKYLESIEGKISEFKATFQELAITLIDSDFVKQIVEWGTGLLNVLNAIAKVIDAVGGLNTVLYVTVSTIAVLKADIIKGAIVSGITKISTAIKSLTGFFTKLKTAMQIYHTMTVASKNASSGALVVYGQSTSALGRLSAAFNAAGIAASTAQIAVAAFMIVLTAIIAVINSVKKAQEEAARQAEENYAKLVDESKAATETQQSLKSLIDRYKELAEASDGAWTTDGMAEVKGLQEQIADLTGDQADTLDLVNGKLDDEYAKLLSIYKLEAQRALATSESEYSASQQRLRAGYENETNWHGASVEDEALASWYVRRAYEELNGVSNTGDGGSNEWWGEQAGYLDTEWLGDVPTALEAIGDYEEGLERLYEWRQMLLDAGKLTDPDSESFFGYNGEVYNTADALSYLNKKITEFEGVISEAEAAKQRFFSNKAAVEALEYLSTTGIQSQEEFVEYARNVMSTYSDKDYARTLVETMSSLLPVFTIPDDVKKEFIANREELIENIAEIVPTTSGRDYEYKSLIADWLDSMDLSEYQSFLNWWELNKDSSIVTGDLGTLKNAFAEYSEQVRRASMTLDDYIAEYNELKNTSDDADEIAAAYENMMDAYVKTAKTDIQALWASDDFADAKAELIGLARSANGISSRKIKQLASSSSELAEILELDGMNAEFLAHIIEYIANGEDGFSLITSEALQLNEALEGMVDEFDKVTEAKNRFEEAMAMDEKDTNFKSLAEAFKVLNDEFVAGTTNSNAFWAAAEFLFGEEQLDAWGWHDGLQNIYDAMSANIGIFQDAESAGLGFLDRLYEISEAGQVLDDEGNVLAEITKLADGSYDFKINYDDISGLAKEMNLSEEAVLGCIEALSMWDDIDFYNIEEVAEVIERVGLATDIAGKKAVNAEALTEQLVALGKTKPEIEDILNGLEDLDGITLIGADMEVDNLLTSIQELGIAASDGVTIEIDYTQLTNMMKELGFTKDEAENVITKLGELDGVQFTSQLGSGTNGVTDVQTVLDYINGIDFSPAEEEVDDVVSAVKELNDTLTGMNGKSISVTIDVVGSAKQAVKDIGAMFGFAKGTDNAPEGAALVGEEGEELVQSGNRAYLVGTNGAEIVNLKQGDRVYTAEETKRIKRSGSIIRGTIPAYSGGGVYGTIKVKKWDSLIPEDGETTTTTTVDVELDPTSLEEQLKDTLKELEADIDEIIGNYEHEIFLAEKHGADASEIIAIYEKMQTAVHEQAEKYRALGLDENSDYIQDLQKQWWDYEESIAEVRQNAFDDYLTDSRFAIDMMKADDASASDISRSYSTILKAINDEIAYYLSKGYDITDDIVQNLIQEAWNVEEEVKSALDNIVAEAQDAVDELQDVYNTLSEAADEYAEYGYITVDSLQSIIDLGVEYMAFLQDENGQLVVNKENIQKVIAARTEQLAVESALNYVEQLRLALEAGNTEELQRLLTATTNATNATWGLVYANLALLNLDDSQYAAALNNINALRSLADNAIANIGASMSGDRQSRSEALQEQKDALDDILEYTMELIEWEAEQQIEALEQQVSDYEEIVELKKEMLKATKEEADYEDELADKIKAIAKLQERINTLSLDDSREAAAERIALEEEMSGLQEELADYQADHMVEAQEGALDDMAEAYAAEKEKEIAAVEETVSSTEKIYQLAIARISNDWDGLYQDLLAYNYEYGNTIQQDLVNAWNAASLAVQEYGSYVNAVSGVDAALNAAESGGYGTTIGTTGTYGEAAQARNIVNSMRQNSIAYWAASDSERTAINSNQLELAQQYRDLTGDQIYRQNGSWYTEGGNLMYSLTANEVATAIVSRMKANSATWSATQSASARSALERENEVLASRLASYLGANVTKNSAGEWYINGEKLYSKYHSGGIAGDIPTLKQDEVMAILQKGEAVLDKRREEGLFRLVDFVTDLSDRFGKLISNVGYNQVFQTQGAVTADELAALSDNKQTSVQFGDVYIYGANDETVEKHREVNRQFVNDVLKQLNIKR